jgi:hypothetical protein
MAAVGLVDAAVGRAFAGSAAGCEAGSANVGGGTISGALVIGVRPLSDGEWPGL